MIEVGDYPNYSLAIGKGKRTLAKVPEIAGMQAKEYLGTGFREISGPKYHDRSYVIFTCAHGDESYLSARSSGPLPVSNS